MIAVGERITVPGGRFKIAFSEEWSHISRQSFAGCFLRSHKGLRTMNYNILGLAAISLLAGSMVATAQTETLDYTGSPFTSLSFTGTMSDALANSLPQNTGELVLSSPLGDNLHNFAVTPVSWSFDSSTPNGVFLKSNNPFPGPDDVATFLFSTNASGMLTAWNIVVSGGILQDTTAQSFAAITINNAGDSFSSGTSSPSCSLPEPNTACFTLKQSNTAAGAWTASFAKAPEIDLTSAGSGLTLLLGGLAVLRGRRSEKNAR